jgi:uncharacterized protein GlcG (DUF336 family)
MALKLIEAKRIVRRGLARAQELKLAVSFAVVDEFADLVQLDRVDNAPLVSPQIAEAKAVTAMKFRHNTSDLLKRDPETLHSLRDVVGFGMMVQAGGVLIYRDGMVVGAIGVSGASEHQDEELAVYAAAEC